MEPGGNHAFCHRIPVTLFDDSDRSLLGTLGNGVNNRLLDTPEVLPGPLRIDNNPRSGKPEFNTGVLVPEALGQLGDAGRRIFHGPGIANIDAQISKKSLSVKRDRSIFAWKRSISSIMRSFTARRRWMAK
jgi:hypothetical protein